MYTYKYNKKGQVKKSVFTNSLDDTKTTASYKYDKKGNLTKIIYSDGYTEVNKITYDKNGNIASVAGEYSVTAYYTWKKMKVSKKLAEQIKAQQWSLTNMDMNFAIPTNSYGM